ncbi:unnamed protein product [Caenorhabditis auriculariae]|uniref:KATNIP domain-containing protein n=1 Tax=Caenorhabditis auriculariae TaxID=2777116 RepID=A0A8S1GRE6_9PELO|nr:unnamed protein product [Caenorhabditis auriculariae]
MAEKTEWENGIGLECTEIGCQSREQIKQGTTTAFQNEIIARICRFPNCTQRRSRPPRSMDGRETEHGQEKAGRRAKDSRTPISSPETSFGRQRQRASECVSMETTKELQTSKKHTGISRQKTFKEILVAIPALIGMACDNGDPINTYPFEIPELPLGELLVFEILSNWGDPTQVGLNSIEIFTSTGRRAEIVEIHTSAECTSGNLKNLITDAVITKKKTEMWSANIEVHRQCTGEEPIRLSVRLREACRIAMIRFWNYNESRVKAQIGVRLVSVLLDGVAIFRGEIDCAFARDTEVEPDMGETVLFTTEDAILEAIAEHDICLIPDTVESTSFYDNTKLSENALTPFRPQTTERGVPTQSLERRPSSAQESGEEAISEGNVKVLQLELASNWGIPDLIGLTSVEILGAGNRLIDMKDTAITVSGGNGENIRKLFNGKNLTRCAEEMWLSEFDPKKAVTITIQFPKPVFVKALSFWNYNASSELSYAGVKLIHVYINGKMVIGHFLLRKAIGNVFFDFVQDILLENHSRINSVAPRPTTRTIGGFVFQLRLLSTWGDEFYIGLNGIEMYNRHGELLRLKQHTFPESVNILPSIVDDPRRSENLIDGVNDTDRPSHMWLTPLLPNRCARIFLVFDTPTYISRLVVYNYRKNFERGVRHITASIDDIIVFSGEVPQSSAAETAKLEINFREVKDTI